MAITLSSTFANALAAHDGTAGQSAIADQLGGGSLVIYACATPPDGANEATNQHATATVLATFTFAAATSWSAPTAGVLPLDIPTLTVTAAASGTATFFRLLSSGSTSLVQGLVATSASDFNLSSTTITSGDNVTINAGPTLTVPVT